MNIKNSSLQQIAKEYLDARKKFLKAIIEYPELAGNDNIVGRIGEFVAMQFLVRAGREVEKCKSATNKGFDLTCSNGRQISVKTITAESKSGKTTKIRPPYDELIMIYIDEEYQVSKLGHINLKDMQRAVRDNFIKPEPIADKRFLEPKGLFGRYGKLYLDQQVNTLL